MNELLTPMTATEFSQIHLGTEWPNRERILLALQRGEKALNAIHKLTEAAILMKEVVDG